MRYLGLLLLAVASVPGEVVSFPSRRFGQRHTVVFVDPTKWHAYKGPAGRYACKSEEACPVYNDIICKSDYNWNWKCSATFRKGYEFAEAKISCDEPPSDDISFTHESCRLTYTVQEKTQGDGTVDNFAELFSALIAMVIVMLLFKCCSGCCRPKEDVPYRNFEYTRALREANLSDDSPDPPGIRGQDTPTDSDLEACIICLTNLKCCAVVPCGHRLFCISCANKDVSDRCPSCRGPIEKIIRVFN
jgi:hypothetical protein